MNVEIILSGIRVRIHFRLDETAKYFDGFITEWNCADYDVAITDEDLVSYPLVCPSGILDPFSEKYMLMARTSAFLLKHRRILFHGVSFIWKEKAWLITALSGVGKTTQYRHWQKLHGDEIEIINGDKSVLEVRDDQTIIVYPSPWKGKEGDAGCGSGELAGIILLEQKPYNKITRIPPAESVIHLFQQFLMAGDTEQEIRSAAGIEETMLEQIPVWKLENIGDEASAILTYETLCEYLEAMK